MESGRAVALHRRRANTRPSHTVEGCDSHVGETSEEPTPSRWARAARVPLPMTTTSATSYTCTTEAGPRAPNNAKDHVGDRFTRQYRARPLRRRPFRGRGTDL